MCLFHRARARGHFKRPVVVIGTNAEALSVVNMLQHSPELGYEVVGLLDCDTAYGVVAPVPVLGQWSDAVEIMQEVDATGVDHRRRARWMCRSRTGSRAS